MEQVSPIISRRVALQAGLSASSLALLSGSSLAQGGGMVRGFGAGQGVGRNGQGRGPGQSAAGNGQGSGEGTGTPCPVDPRNPSIVWRRGHCEMCDHCEKSCGMTQAVRGYYSLEKTHGKPICIHCGQCTNLCKNGAMVERFDYPYARRVIRTAGITPVISVAPAVRVSLGEMFGMQQGADVEGKVVAALKKLGFKYVLDATFGADLTVIEEATELVARIQSPNKTKYPMFTSCCPGWVKFAEYWYPEFLPFLSSVKSPLLMQGALVKTYFAKKLELEPDRVASILVAPCTAKKFEITRPEMNAAGQYWKNDDIRDMDLAITVRELGRWIEESGIDFKNLKPQPFDSIMGRGSEAGLIFGNTGGVMEAALRTAWFMINDKPAPENLLKFEPIRGLDAVKEAEVDLGSKKIRVAAVHGGRNTRNLMDKIRSGEAQYDFVEVMICPGGCVGGGGQPKVQGRAAFQEVRENRNAGLYKMAQNDKIRYAHENPEALKAYSEFLLSDGNDLRAKLLHTSYTDRSADLGE